MNINKIIRKGEEFIKYLPIIRTGRTLPWYFLNKNVRNYKFIHWLFVSLCIPAVFVHSHQNSMLKFHFHCNTVKRRAFHEVFRFWEWHSYGVQPSAIGESLLLQDGDFILDISDTSLPHDSPLFKLIYSKKDFDNFWYYHLVLFTLNTIRNKCLIFIN